MQLDSLQRFVFENTDIRGAIVRLNHSFTTIMKQHQYPESIFNVLGQTLASSVLMRSSLKFNGQFTVQFQGKGPVTLLVAKCTEDFKIRGLAQFDENLLADEKNLLVGGQLVVTVSPDASSKPYQSIIPLINPNIAINIENYFGQSVQLPTRLWLAVDKSSAAGLLLQLLPSKVQTIQERELFWEYAVRIGETITSKELLSLNNQEILHRLYHDQDIRIFEPNPIEFKCNCNKKRMDNVVRMVGKEEIESILEEKQVVDITCEYCNTVYTYDKIDIAAIFAN